MERTEEDKITQGGITVILGGIEYKIAPLVIRYSGEWRKKALPLIGSLLKYSRLISSDTDDTSGLEKSVIELFTTKTDEMLDSFFEYARDLDREEISNIATDGEIILAFMEVFNAFVAPLSVAPKKKETSPLEQSLNSS